MLRVLMILGVALSLPGRALAGELVEVEPGQIAVVGTLSTVGLSGPLPLASIAAGTFQLTLEPELWLVGEPVAGKLAAVVSGAEVGARPESWVLLSQPALDHLSPGEQVLVVGVLQADAPGGPRLLVEELFRGALFHEGPAHTYDLKWRGVDPTGGRVDLKPRVQANGLRALEHPKGLISWQAFLLQVRRELAQPKAEPSPERTTPEP